MNENKPKIYFVVLPIMVVIIVLLIIFIINTEDSDKKVDDKNEIQIQEEDILRIVSSDYDENLEYQNIDVIKVKKDFRKDCEQIQDLIEKVNCLKPYMLGKHDTIREEYNDCVSNSNEYCDDQFYYEVGITENKNFCEAIENQYTRNECLNVADIE